jgi:anti-sigma factor RsiW
MTIDEKSNAPELTCKELVELVTDYLEGKLPPVERARFETHLARCRHCTNYLAQMQQTIQLVGRLTEETIEPDSRDDLLAIFRDWKRSQ